MTRTDDIALNLPAPAVTSMVGGDSAGEKEFEALLRQCEADLRAFLAAVVRDGGMREEVYQETVREMWSAFGRFDPSRPFGAWARGVARNVIRRHARARAREALIFSDAAVEAVAAAWEEASAEESRLTALEECLERLSPECREAISHFYTGRLRVAAIAGRMGCSVATVYQFLSRGRARLAACVRLRLAHSEDSGSATTPDS